MEVIGEIERDDGTVVTVLGANPNHSHAPVTTVSTPEPETVAA
jgi:hypothetical protein